MQRTPLETSPPRQVHRSSALEGFIALTVMACVRLRKRQDLAISIAGVKKFLRFGNSINMKGYIFKEFLI
jgi:hypothetical protein